MTMPTPQAPANSLSAIAALSDVETEEKLLGTILVEPWRLDDLKITSNEFYREKHQWIFDAMRRLQKDGATIEFGVLVDQLDRDGILEKVGGSAYLMRLMNSEQQLGNWKIYERIIHDKFKRRQAQELATDLSEIAHSGTDHELELVAARARSLTNFEVLTPPSHSDEQACPPLPAGVLLPPDRGANASPWLNDYIAFSKKWSPRSYDGFHEAVAIWLLSTIAARRVVLHLGKPFFTPLFVALVSRTSLWVKTTTAEIGISTLRAANLDWLLCADDITPQKLISDLTPRVPEYFEKLTSKQQTRIRNRLALTAQRGWWFDEFGQLLEAMNRENGVMADFRGMLRRFDDCKEEYEKATLGRGSDSVERPYLSLLGAMTPADMRFFAKRGGRMWGDGFWARFAFVSPNGEDFSRARFPDGERKIPPELANKLVEWHDHLGVPDVKINPVLNDEGKPTGRFQAEIGELPEKRCTLGVGVYDAFYAYNDALLGVIAAQQNQDFDGNYARFSEKALRIAMLLASLENGNRIELSHWARAQQITERWRANLHSLAGQLQYAKVSERAEQEQRVLKFLKKLGRPTATDIKRYIPSMGTSEVTAVLESLVKSGAARPSRTKRAIHYSLTEDAGVEQ